MRIAWISYDFGEFCIPQVQALAEHNELFLALAVRAGTERQYELDPTIASFFFDRPRLRQPLRQILTANEILRRLRTFRADVIHLQAGHLWFNCFLPALRRTPLVVTIHDPRHHAGDSESRKTPQIVMDFGYRRADRVIVHGRSLVSAVHEEVGIPLDRIHVVPLVAISDPASPGYMIEENENEVLFFGRIWDYKGLEFLIRAEPLVSSRVPELKIIIAGAGGDIDRYRRMMQHPERFIVLNRWISDEERSEIFQRAAVVVLPYTSATQSGVVSVAYSFAKPVIATRVGALPDSVEHGITGILVPPRNEGALAEAIISLLVDKGARRSMGEAGHRKLTSECSPSEVAKQTEEIYRLAIRDRGATTPQS